MKFFRIIVLFLVLIVLASSSSTSSFGSHGSSGGGGGCSGDCTPPTLGLGEQGKIRVTEGLTINSESFDVEYYSQTIPTQVLKTGEKNKILLKIYENSSPEFLSHVELHFEMKDKVIEGVIVEESTVSIIWDDKGGDIVQAVYGKEEMLEDVSIDYEIENNLAIISIEFIFVESLDASTLMINIWDEKRNSSKNYFYEAIMVIDELKPLSDNLPFSGNDTAQELQLQSPTSDKTSTIPLWIKNNAGWWSENKITDSDFILGMQYLIDIEVLSVPQIDSAEAETDTNIPSWIKNTAGWWAKDQIQDTEFIQSIQFLLNKNFVNF